MVQVCCAFVVKLSGLTVLFLNFRMKEVTVADRKVLLVCTGGQYSAVGGQCSHYNAPLVKGTLPSTLCPSVCGYRKEKNPPITMFCNKCRCIGW